ncbi:hypothetical protein psal_cds_293 [Pandoravirus salinus]|uniref:Uncharacterized protein n=1 Tax=Pandoravirus salinus TaxID=1349410 RepID=S4VWR5_9VIRU|nr:hypothetical protein psal_cds_293 [Pandoravirus salinus]AGO83886.1 hypothetical protein psal_cds_293 [Pandoravirus salinus]
MEALLFLVESCRSCPSNRGLVARVLIFFCAAATKRPLSFFMVPRQKTNPVAGEERIGPIFALSFSFELTRFLFADGVHVGEAFDGRKRAHLWCTKKCHWWLGAI